jgi:hypothetical protein
MSHNLTQPEEIELFLREFEVSEKKANGVAKGIKHDNAQQSIHVGYIPPYRAAYLSEKEKK